MATPQREGEAAAEPTAEGEVDDFAEEIAAQLRNPALMRLLDERSKEKVKSTLEEVRARLQME